MTLVAVLGLMVAGFLSRVAIVARRRRIIVDRAESHWMDNRNEHELRDRQKRSESAYQWNKLIDDFVVQPESDWQDDQSEYELQKRSGSTSQWDEFTNDLHRSLIPTKSYGSREKPQRNDRDSAVADEIGKREHMLEQLRRDLDRLLRSPKAA